MLPLAIVLMLPVFITGKGLTGDFFSNNFLHNLPPVAISIFSVIIIAFNSYKINSLSTKYLKGKEKNFVAAFFYLLLTSATIFWFGFSRVILATPFFIVSLNYLLQINHQKNILDLSFRAGFWLGIAAVVEINFITLLVFYLFSLFFIRSSSLREWLVMIIGFTVPFLFFGYYCLIFNQPLIEQSITYGTRQFYSFWKNQNLYSHIFFFTSIVLLGVMVLGYLRNLSSAVHHDRISKITFGLISIGIVSLALFNISLSFSDYLFFIWINLAIFSPSVFLLFKKKKRRQLLLDFYVYLVLILIVLDLIK